MCLYTCTQYEYNKYEMKENGLRGYVCMWERERERNGGRKRNGGKERERERGMEERKKRESDYITSFLLSQILVSCGAYSVLSHVIQGFIQSGDEVKT